MNTKSRWILLSVWWAFTLTACGSLPSLDSRTLSNSLTPEEAQTTSLGQTVAPLTEAHSGKSGIRTLAEAKDAFAARLLLAEAAEQTLDIQYYLWRDDKTGLLLMQALYAAAERGVHVRLLLDDLNTAPIDSKLAALNDHPNIEVRLFNPFANRGPRTFGFVTDFPRANRRMHNKSFTADNSATIVGGRNIGDDYFSAADGILFADLDVVAIGPVVAQVSADFDLFWSSLSSYPAEYFLREPSSTQHERTLAVINARPGEAELYLEMIQEQQFFRDFLNGHFELHWADTKMVSDNPAKGLGEALPEQLITHELQEIIGHPEHSLLLVSPYFVPTKAGVDALRALANQGVEVSLLTNSLRATDVVIVHAGYAKWRRDLLQAGIRLFEMRATAPSQEPDDRRLPRFGSAATSLHAKTFAVDAERVFIGSFNFDPRSAQLNTELGFVIESSKLAHELETIFERDVPHQAYEVRLSPSGRIYWLERTESRLVRYDNEPGVNLAKRGAVRMFSWLPIDWLL